MTEKPAETSLADDSFPCRIWRDDINSLQFAPEGHRGFCVVHRLAFRTLLEFNPGGADCLAYFDSRHDTFLKAARDKIASRQLPPSSNFHLNSRDIRRAASGVSAPANFRA